MTAEQMKRIVLCFERWLDNEFHPLLREFIQKPSEKESPPIPPILEKSLAAAMQDIEVAKKDSPEVRTHTVRHAEAMTPDVRCPPGIFGSDDVKTQPTGFARLLGVLGKSVHAEASESTEVAPLLSPTLAGVEVGEFRATVNGQLKRVRMLDKAGGVLRVQVIRDDGGLSLTILTSIDQVHVDDRASVAHLFPEAK